jgi:hypothetical protein
LYQIIVKLEITVKSCSSRCISFWDISSASLFKNSFVKGQNLRHPHP